MARSREIINDLTVGSVPRKLLTFALPFMLSTLLQIGVYAGSILSQASFGYVLYTVLLRLLLDMAVLSVPSAPATRSVSNLPTVLSVERRKTL